MTLISSKEFATCQDKYFDMALDEEVYIERGGNVFYLSYKTISKEQEYLEPDDDLRNAITMDELLEKVKEHIHQLYAKKK